MAPYSPCCAAARVEDPVDLAPHAHSSQRCREYRQPPRTARCCGCSCAPHQQISRAHRPRRQDNHGHGAARNPGCLGSGHTRWWRLLSHVALVNTAGALDPALWAIGKYGCKATCEKGGEKTRIADFCSTCRFDELFRAGSKDRPGSIGPAGSQKEPRRRRQRALSTLDEEHYKVALSYNGRPFTAKEFKARYRHTYADRPETSILPADRCIRRSRSTRRMIKSLIRHADGPPRRLDDNGDVELAND